MQRENEPFSGVHEGPAPYGVRMLHSEKIGTYGVESNKNRQTYLSSTENGNMVCVKPVIVLELNPKCNILFIGIPWD